MCLVDFPRKALPPLKSGWGMERGKRVTGEGEGGKIGVGMKMKSKFF